jgi:hypothetical protein
LWERKRLSLIRKRNFLHKGDIILKSHAGNEDKKVGSKESFHDQVVERYDQLSKNNFEILVEVVFVKLKEEDAFKSKLGKGIFNENRNDNG